MAQFTDTQLHSASMSYQAKLTGNRAKTKYTEDESPDSVLKQYREFKMKCNKHIKLSKLRCLIFSDSVLNKSVFKFDRIGESYLFCKCILVLIIDIY